MKKLIFLFFIVFSFYSSAQTIRQEGKKMVSILASDDFHGRGYTNNGLKIAADFLEREYKKYGLQKVNGSYRQDFDLPINIIKKADLSINQKPLKLGFDFLPAPTSHTANLMNIKTKMFDWKSLLSEEKISQNIIDSEGKFLVFDMVDLKSESDSIQKMGKEWVNWLKQNNETDLPFVGMIILQNENFIHSLRPNAIKENIIYLKKEKFKPNSTFSYKVKTEENSAFKTANIIGKVAGTQSDSALFVTAHYDHLGQIGNTVFNGANDNASGTAMLLSLAKYFAKNPTKYDIYFVGFSGEEAGLMGSQYFVENAPIDMKKIKFLINLDMNGTGEDGIQIVNSTIFPKKTELLEKINSKKQLLKQIKLRGESCNSDHCPFYLNGVPSFFIYTLGGVSYYHNPLDRAETLPLTEFEDLHILLVDFLRNF